WRRSGRRASCRRVATTSRPISSPSSPARQFHRSRYKALIRRRARSRFSRRQVAGPLNWRPSRDADTFPKLGRCEDDQPQTERREEIDEAECDERSEHVLRWQQQGDGRLENPDAAGNMAQERGDAREDVGGGGGEETDRRRSG